MRKQQSHVGPNLKRRRHKTPPVLVFFSSHCSNHPWGLFYIGFNDFGHRFIFAEIFDQKKDVFGGLHLKRKPGLAVLQMPLRPGLFGLQKAVKARPNIVAYAVKTRFSGVEDVFNTSPSGLQMLLIPGQHCSRCYRTRPAVLKMLLRPGPEESPNPLNLVPGCRNRNCPRSYKYWNKYIEMDNKS